ncbi:hypothetical protein [Paludisphaera borealis]|uniref:Glycosyl hydrolase family 98 putative carbohydrate-binding module domain-containing protein n=1 Tax=Paludisphaera borealis TaxID=1387353 RepID=A0A1U7CVR0_9BACT|nr:hypothetical protein [Paludisphaera borealis]APW63032.1 hypothetical protein BSF38_04590 [Paludisphaera borealis]
MPEHLIRLRGGWKLHDLDAEASNATPLTLPVAWESRPVPRRLRLVRKFGRPKIGRARLVLEAVEGLRAMTLNDDSLAVDAAPPGRLDVDLPPLGERNVLVLDVVIESASDEPASPWGNIALAISE